ncbi:nuclear transport factor 2 family protein [bacterium]|nr:nuclear transport factor 2 family protein [bacterium]
MKFTRIAVFALFLMLGIAVLGLTKFTANPDAAREDVQSLIESAYLNGAFNDLNTEAMKQGFHSEFAIFSAKGEELQKYPIATWIDRIEKRKAKPDFDPNSSKWDYKFSQIDITGGSAAAKIELFKDSELVYTDYLSLLKFDSGWKIVAKVYHKHTD